jgi:hypothetical protein
MTHYRRDLLAGWDLVVVILAGRGERTLQHTDTHNLRIL